MRNKGLKLSLALIAMLTILVACATYGGEATPTLPPSPTALPPTPASPTETLIPPPRFFTEEFDADALHWEIFLTNGDQTLFGHKIEEGHWSFMLGGKYMYVYAIYQPETYREVRIDARAANQGQNKNFTSLICDFSLKEGWYEFNASNDGRYYLLHGIWDASLNRPRYTVLVDGGSNLIKYNNGVNEYGLVCKGRMLTLFINGEEIRIIEEKESALRSGQVGIGVSSFDVLPIQVDFDSVTVSEPPQE